MSVPDQATTAVIAAGIAACAALISLLTLLFNLRSAKRASVSSSNAAKAAERSNQIAMGQSESGLRTSITECRERYEDVCAQLEEFVDGRKFAELGEREQRKAKTMEARLRSSMENLANAYEIACSQYIDDKIDRIRFKRTYAVEIRKMVESDKPVFQRLFHPEGTSAFKAIWSVYRAWNDLENNPAP